MVREKIEARMDRGMDGQSDNISIFSHEGKSAKKQWHWKI